MGVSVAQVHWHPACLQVRKVRARAWRPALTDSAEREVRRRAAALSVRVSPYFRRHAAARTKGGDNSAATAAIDSTAAEDLTEQEIGAIGSGAAASDDPVRSVVAHLNIAAARGTSAACFPRASTTPVRPHTGTVTHASAAARAALAALAAHRRGPAGGNK